MTKKVEGCHDELLHRPGDAEDADEHDNRICNVNWTISRSISLI